MCTIVSDKNRNDQIDWNDTDRIVSNDTRYVSLDGDWWRESSTWQTRQNGSPTLTRVGLTRTRLTGLGKNGEAASSLLVQPGISNLQPQYDADGNQTLVTTKTGRWRVTYNGENRPVRWELVSPDSNTPNSNTQTPLQMSYDHMGRRRTKNNQRFIYNGYLQIANVHSSTSTSHFNYYLWDPTEPVATRPLVWTTPTANHESPITNFYTHDGNKNVSEVIASNNDIAAHYEYAPFGALTVSRGEAAATNPFRFSSEYAEDDTATVYYNYRHYEPVMGRWLRRDPIGESSWVNYDGFCVNAPLVKFDILGLDVGCDDVDHFWQMLLYAVIFQSQHYSVQNTGRVYKDAVNTLKERFVWEVPVSCSELPQGKVLINEQVRFGGYLFKNFLSDQWGPFTYGFYTLGNAHVVGSLSYSSVPIGDVRIFDQCACCFNTRITLNVLISDRFDFVPDRKFWEADTLKNKLSELVYDGLALPWWLGYNIFLGASRPTVEINISETWEEILCAKK